MNKTTMATNTTEATNTTDEKPINDIIEYAKRYGLKALGYAIYNMCQNENETFNPSWNCVSEIWTYGGNVQPIEKEIKEE